MKDIDDIRRDNLRLLEIEFGSSTAVAEVVGMTQSQFNNLRRGAADSVTGKPRGMRKETARRIERATDKPRGWLDEDHSSSTSTGASLPPQNGKPNEVNITRFATGGAMGGGIELPDQPGVIENVRVSREWIQKNVRNYTAVSNLRIVTGFGDSMRPMFNPGDPLIVDCGIQSVDIDAIYFFRVGNEGFIKRLQRVPSTNGLIINVISDNTLYPPWPIEQGMDFEVFGRVLKVWRSEDF